MAQTPKDVPEEITSSFLSNLVADIVYSPLNLALLALCVYLLYKIFYTRKEEAYSPVSLPPPLPPMKKRDMTHQELKKYNGVIDERVCVAVNGKIFDVTKGKRFYGPGGPYASFAGGDASRGLATFSVEVPKDDYDDLSDLNSMQMDSVREWEIQFQEKYQYVGRLLRPGEEPTDYSDEEDTSQDQSTEAAQQTNQQSSKKDE
ncbi:membrane-associated progesterone receptor component 1 [Parasteatoda tepidariorum]|nr:membrane-associated progesterone receptor component 1 [Parasteatoda tepidariorum]